MPPPCPRVLRRLAAVLPAAEPIVGALECVLAVLLAIALAHLLGAKNVSWAAFSAYMVLRSRVADTLLRGALRVLGTAAGAGIALLVVPAVQGYWPLASLAGAAIGGGALFAALANRFSYAWMLTGLTFEMILLDKLAQPALAITAFAATRLLEVGAGTGACIAVSALAALTVRRRWPGPAPEAPQQAGSPRQALRHAAQGALALALLPVLGRVTAMPDLAQGAVSIMAVMLVPASSLASGSAPVSRKLMQRIAGCLAGAAVATPVLLLAHGSAPVLILGTIAGVVAGRDIETGWHAFAYGGTQFTLAVLVALVPDSYADAAIAPALARLAGILIGMALLEPVLLAWRLAPRATIRAMSSIG